jgi:hypothetical protein
MFRAVGLAYVFALHVVLALMIANTQIAPKMRAWLVSSGAIDYVTPRHSIIFLGDSITAAMPEIPGAVNYGVPQQSSAQLLARLPRYRSIDSARAVYLLIGINDLVRNEPLRVDELAAAIPPSVPLVWSGIMPTSHLTVTAESIEAANAAIQRACATRGNCRFVDTRGIVKPGAFKPDGLHLSDVGYRAWLEALGLNHVYLTNSTSGG